jgi:hypothetical protein
LRLLVEPLATGGNAQQRGKIDRFSGFQAGYRETLRRELPLVNFCLRRAHGHNSVLFVQLPSLAKAVFPVQPLIIAQLMLVSQPMLPAGANRLSGEAA